MRRDETGLWRYNRTTGIWNLSRVCMKNTAKEWLRVWQKDEPSELFKLSTRRPK